MKKYYLILFLFIPLFSLAQSNYKSGYIVNLKGDTMRGYINYKEWVHNPATISFKPVLTASAKDLGTSDISYFEISSYVSYHAYAVSISLNPVDIASVQSAPDTTTTTANVFLKVLEKGRYVTLYAYKDDLKEHFYIKENNLITPAELSYGIYEDPNNSINIINRNGYQAQLNELVEKYQPGSDKLIAEVQQARYKDYILIPIVTRINGSPNDEISAKSGSHNPPIRFFAGASFISSNLKFTNVTESAQFYGAAPSTSSSPKISLGLDLIANPDVGHLIFRLELAYTQDKFSFSEQPIPIYNDANPFLNSESYKMDVFFITPQVVYNIYNEAMLKVFIDAGYSINLLSYPNTMLITSRDGQVQYSQTAQGLDANKGNSSTFEFKTGVIVNKRFEIYGMYFLPAQVTDSFAYNTRLTSYQVGVNYFIGKVAQ